MFKNVLRFLLVFLGMMVIVSGGFVSVFAAEKPEIFVQLGHQKSVATVAFSPDGMYAVTGSEDFTAKLWIVASGREMTTFSGHAATISAVAVSSGGLRVAAGDEKGNIKVWDAITGREIRSLTIRAKNPKVSFLAFSPDAATVSSVAWDGVLTVWDIASGRTLKTVERIRAYGFITPGENFLAAEIDYQKYALVESYSGRTVDTFSQDKSFFPSTSFSRDGRYGLFRWDDYSANRTYFETYDISEKRRLASWHAAREMDFNYFTLSPDGRLAVAAGHKGMKMWEALSGREIKTLTTSFTRMATFSADGQFFISAGLYIPTLWETETGRVVRSFGRSPLSNVYSAAASPDSRQAVAVSTDAPPLLWDMAMGSPVKIFKDYSNASDYSGDGRHILLVSKQKTIELWDMAADQKVKVLQGKRVVFSRDGRLMAEQVADRQVSIWELASAKEVLNYTEPAGAIQRIAFSENNRYLLIGLEKAAKRIDFETVEQKVLSWQEPYYGSLKISPDGRYIAVIGMYADLKNPNTLHLYDVEASRTISSFKDATPAASMDFSPDGRRLLFSRQHDLVLCDTALGTVLRTFTGHRDTVWHLGFTAGGDRILSAGCDRNIILWDTASARVLMTFAGHNSSVRRAVISADGKQVISAADDHTIRLWDVDTGKERAKFLSFTDGEWIVITPEGYYNSSPNGEKHLNVRIGNTVYGIDSYREAFFRPDVVKIALAGGSLRDFRKLADVKPPPSVSIVDTPRSVAADNVTVKLRLADNGGGIGDIRLYLNGTAVVMDSRAVKVIASAAADLIKEYTLKLAAGSNTIQAVAFNADNTMQSNEATLEVSASFAAVGKPSLSALVIGINEFKNPKLKLNYTVADAELFAQALEQVSAGLFDKVNIRKLTAGETTTNAAIIREIQSFQSLRPDDLFVFYIASHGTVDEGEYFLITSNVGSLRTEKLRTDAISQNMLKEAIANIPATKKLIIIDTCNAGALGDALQMAMLTRGMSEDTALKILSRAMGSTILSASTSVQEALEGYQGHGLFTYVLAEGLKGLADKGKTGYIKTTDLADYVDNEVPLLAEKVFKRAQYPTISISGQAFPIGRIK
ncbi:MAG: caspase family protein [Desulfobacterales bacterium]|nr:caspase family protein [Desulfobacterales bacterium]